MFTENYIKEASAQQMETSVKFTAFQNAKNRFPCDAIQTRL